MSWLTDRLSEPSTHAGLGALSVVLSSFFPMYHDVILAVGGVFGAIAALAKDPGTGG